MCALNKTTHLYVKMAWGLRMEEKDFLNKSTAEIKV